MKQGFTLIELMVVVIIIGVLAAVAMPQYTKAVERARTADVVSTLGDIMTAQRIYQVAHNEYTTDLTALDIEVPGAADGAFSVSNFDGEVSVDEDDGSILAVGVRNGSTSAAGYALGLHMTTEGVITRYCDDDDSDVKICASMSSDWVPFPEAEEHQEVPKVKQVPMEKKLK